MCFSRNLVMDLIRLGCVVYIFDIVLFDIFRGIFIYEVPCVIWYIVILENFTKQEENLLREKKVSQT